MCIQCVFNVYSMYTQYIYLYINCEANDSHLLTHSHTPNLEMLSHLKILYICSKEMKLSGLCGGASMYCLLLNNNNTNCEINRINSNKQIGF